MEQERNKHYIQQDEQGRVVKGFSDAFEQPADGDICVTEQGGRHFEWDGVINPTLFDEQGIPLYKGKMERRSAEEIEADRAKLPPPPKSEAELLREELEITQLALAELAEVMLNG